MRQAGALSRSAERAVIKISATPKTGTAPLTVTFRVAGSADPNPNGKITQYSFNFGDGSALVNHRGATPVTHTYNAAGTPIASLTVTDSEGGTATDKVKLTIQ